MAHLHCKAHKRRVIKLPNGNVYHRNGEGGLCDTNTIEIFNQKWNRVVYTADNSIGWLYSDK